MLVEAQDPIKDMLNVDGLVHSGLVILVQYAIQINYQFQMRVFLKSASISL